MLLDNMSATGIGTVGSSTRSDSPASPGWADRLMACLSFTTTCGECVLSRQRLHLALQHRQKSLALLNTNDYHLHQKAATCIPMRLRQDFWVEWLARILVALGLTAIAAGSVLIAWMSLQLQTL